MKRPTAITIGVAVAIGVTLSIVPDRAFYSATTAGLATGDGRQTNPITMAVQTASPITGTGSAGAPIGLTLSKGTEFSGTGSAGSPLSVSAGFQALGYGEFGDGSDGVCNFDGASTVLGLTPTSGRYKLDRDIFCSSMTVASGASINAAAQIYVLNTLTLSGRIDRNGFDGVAGSSGSVDAGVTLTTTTNGGGTQTPVPREFCGPTGCLAVNGYAVSNACAAGGANAVSGTNGANGANGAWTGCGGGGGARCNAVSTAGGSSGPNLNSSNSKGVHYLDAADGQFLWHSVAGYQGVNKTGSGGGIGTGVSLNGGGTTSGGWVVVHAHEIVGSGTIEARGGNGGLAEAATTTNCPGGGGGGGGGIVTIVIGTGSFPSYSVAGGIGATGHTATSGANAGLKGGNGGNGAAGMALLYRVGPQ